MDKKRKISWGVSFGSLALVAGMVSYLGLNNGFKTNNQIGQNQFPPSTAQGNQGAVNQGPGQGYDNDQGFNDSFVQGDSTFGQDNSQFDQGPSDGGFFSDGQQDQFSRGSRGHGHRDGFDTTTGGT